MKIRRVMLSRIQKKRSAFVNQRSIRRPIQHHFGFTLIELIAVLAIIVILAGLLVPNVLRQIENSALKAELQTDQNLGEAIKQYLRINGTVPTTVIPPTLPNWTSQLAASTDLSANDILNTKRQTIRTYVVEPGVFPPTRAMIISSMRTGVAVPVATGINTLARFDDIWTTADGVIPSGASAGLWGVWSASNANYLTVVRISFDSINKTDFQNAEVLTTQSLGNAVKQYLRTVGTLPSSTIPPTLPNWTTQLSPYTELSPTSILTTKRQTTRTYVIEPGVNPATRAMIISSMIVGLAVPTAANINTLARFDDIWTTADGTVPTGASAGLWTGWNAGNAASIVVQRISLQVINKTDLQALTVQISKSYSAGIVSYKLISGSTGAILASNASIAGTTTFSVPVAVHPRDRLDLYTGVNYGVLSYSYIFSADNINALTFSFLDSVPTGSPYWRPQ
jgi:prepilin-type N-terminal cleavage/methylation domain-containing protein